MSITLYQHNESAYHAALTMLRKTGKAAVIHPTGTGKSFIGFKFSEDFPQWRVCWFSPSEYISRAQLRKWYKQGKLTTGQIGRLEAIGMIWEAPKQSGRLHPSPRNSGHTQGRKPGPGEVERSSLGDGF